MASKRITLSLTDANAAMVNNVADVLNKSVQDVIAFCLWGSTNPWQWLDANIKNFCREVQPTLGMRTTKQEKQNKEVRANELATSNRAIYA